jgi:anti-anti-sigma factor
MTIEVHEAEGSVVVALSGSVDIFEAGALHERAREITALNRDVVVDLGDAVRMDVSAIQILLAMKEAQRERGRRFSIISAPDGIREDWRLTGLQSVLGPD